MDSNRMLQLKSVLSRLVVVLLIGVLTGPIVSADTLETDEHQITMSSEHDDWWPTLGNDGNTDLVVYSVREVLPGGHLGPGDIWYQPLVGGAPSGAAVQVTSGISDDQLNDVSGDHIVFTAFDSTTATSGAIIVYQISSGVMRGLGFATIIQEPKIHGTRVVWREGGVTAARVMYASLTDPIGTAPREIAGPAPPTFDIQIGSRFAVWAEFDNSQYDVYAYDFDADAVVQVTDTAINERQPATSGDWIVWQQDTSTIEAKNMLTLERVTIDNGANNYNPSIDGDLITWESAVIDNVDIWVYRLSTGETYQVTDKPYDVFLNDVFGDMVAYVGAVEKYGTLNFIEDIYVSTLTFVPETVILDFDVDPSGATVPGGTIASEQWADIGVHVACNSNVAGHPDACIVIDSEGPPFQTDLGTHCQSNTLIVAQNVEDLDGNGLVDSPVSETGGGQIRLTFDEPVDVSTVTVTDIDTDEGGSGIMVVTDAGGGTIIVPIPVFGNGIVQTVAVDVPYAIELTINFIHDGSLAAVTYTPTTIPQVAIATPVTFSAEPEVCNDNDYPVADAGDDRGIIVDQLVQLDGSNSSHGWPEGVPVDPLVFDWQFEPPAGSLAVLDGADTAFPTFIPDVAGQYVASLRVYRVDTDKYSYWDDVTLTTTWNVYETLQIDPASIDFGAEHPGNTVERVLTLTYSCTGTENCATLSVDSAMTNIGPVDQFLSSEVVELPNDGTPTKVVITFAPTGLGDVEGVLGIRDNIGLAAIVPLSGTGANEPPVAHAGPDQQLLTLGQVMLQGGGSGDPDGDEITYLWSLTGPAGSGATLSDPTAVEPTFIADVFGDYGAELRVTDEWSTESMPDTVKISFENVAPTADAGDNQSVFVGEDAILDGGGSMDPNGDTVTYTWSFTSTPVESQTTLIFDSESAGAYFYADVAGTYHVRLTVSDGELENTDTVQVQALEIADGISLSLSNAIEALNALDNSDFAFKRARRFLTAKINFALNSMDRGRYRRALVILERTVLRRMDGCALRGEPDTRRGVDTITNCAAQAQVYPDVLHAVELLREFVDTP